jgi:DNA-binding NarL/FixJ family response regulator
MLHTEITQSVPAPGAPKAVLTPREIEVLRLLADGMSSKDVASHLRISFKTATSHRSNILAKLRVHDTVLAVRWAIRERLIEA